MNWDSSLPESHPRTCEMGASNTSPASIIGSFGRMPPKQVCDSWWPWKWMEHRSALSSEPSYISFTPHVKHRLCEQSFQKHWILNGNNDNETGFCKTSWRFSYALVYVNLREQVKFPKDLWAGNPDFMQHLTCAPWQKPGKVWPETKLTKKPQLGSDLVSQLLFTPESKDVASQPLERKSLSYPFSHVNANTSYSLTYHLPINYFSELISPSMPPFFPPPISPCPSVYSFPFNRLKIRNSERGSNLPQVT